MVDAKALLNEIGKGLQSVNEQLLRHPYVQALEEGKIGREKLRLFAGEQYVIIGSDLRSAAHLVGRSVARRAVIFSLAFSRAKELPGMRY